MKILISLLLVIVVFSSCQKGPGDRVASFWKPYSKEALADAVTHHRPVVIDFFAEWCPICHELDRTLFSLPQIQALLSQVTALRMDATNQDDPQVQAIAQQYEIEGLPTIIFLDSHGKEVNNSRIIGFVTPQDFTQAFALFKIFK